MALEIHAITTTVTCSVSGGEGHLSAEVDARPFGLNGGRSQFFPGCTCYVLVYVSTNVNIMGSFVSDGSFYVPDGPVSVATGNGLGDLSVYEGIAFTTPLANISKPTHSLGSPLRSKESKCGGLIHVPGTTTVRLTDWQGSGKIDGEPPHAFYFVKYLPIARVGHFVLPNIPTGDLKSYNVTANIYGVSTPAY